MSRCLRNKVNPGANAPYTRHPSKKPKGDMDTWWTDCVCHFLLKSAILSQAPEVPWHMAFTFKLFFKILILKKRGVNNKLYSQKLSKAEEEAPTGFLVTNLMSESCTSWIWWCLIITYPFLLNIQGLRRGILWVLWWEVLRCASICSCRHVFIK